MDNGPRNDPILPAHSPQTWTTETSQTWNDPGQLLHRGTAHSAQLLGFGANNMTIVRLLDTPAAQA